MQRVTYEDVRKLLQAAGKADDAFAILRLFVGVTGDHVAAMTLNQIVYWSDKTEDETGLFYKTAKDWNIEIGVSYYQLKRACKILEACGLETKTKHVNRIPTSHYRLVPESFYAEIVKFLQSEESLNLRNLNLRNSKIENVQPSDFVKKPHIEETLNSRNLDSKLKKLEFPLKEKTENTTENTKEKDGASADAARISQKKIKSNGNGKPKARDLVFEALAELCEMDIADLTEKTRGQLNRVCKHFREKYGGKPEDSIIAGFSAFAAWWKREEWRGKQGNPPNPYQVQENWKRFATWFKAQDGKSQKGVAAYGQVRA